LWSVTTKLHPCPLGSGRLVSAEVRQNDCNAARFLQRAKTRTLGDVRSWPLPD